MAVQVMDLTCYFKCAQWVRSTSIAWDLALLGNAHPRPSVSESILFISSLKLDKSSDTQ